MVAVPSPSLRFDLSNRLHMLTSAGRGTARVCCHTHTNAQALLRKCTNCASVMEITWLYSIILYKHTPTPHFRALTAPQSASSFNKHCNGWSEGCDLSTFQPWSVRKNWGFVIRCNRNKRIWPLGDLFGVFSHEVVLAEDEKGTVNGEAVLSHRDGVVQGHGARALSHRLLVHTLPSRWAALPAGPARRAALPVRMRHCTATSTSAVPGRRLVCEPRHSARAERQSSRSGREKGGEGSAWRPHHITSHTSHTGGTRRFMRCAYIRVKNERKKEKGGTVWGLISKS